MKLKKLKKSKFLPKKLQSLKLYHKKKFFEKKQESKSTEIVLHKITNIIRDYHIKDKKILFIGFPDDFATTLKNTRHLCIPKVMWSNGILTNSSSSYRKKNIQAPRKIFKLTVQLKKKADLIFVYNMSQNTPIVKEITFANVPIIAISTKPNTLNTKQPAYLYTEDYRFFFKKVTNADFFISLASSILTPRKKIVTEVAKKFIHTQNYKILPSVPNLKTTTTKKKRYQNTFKSLTKKVF